MRRWALLLIIVALVVAAIMRMLREPASVLLITVDTLRPDRLSCYGYDAQRTAGICSLAEQGTLFENAVCDIPWTTGSMASVMTGTYSSRHGVRLPNQRLSADHRTLAALLKARGYQTGAIIGSFPLASLYGLNQGFDVYDEEFSQAFISLTGEARGPVDKIPLPTDFDDSAAALQWAQDKMFNDSFRPDAEVTDRAVNWLEQAPHRPFFLWVHYFGPHERLYIEPGNPLSTQEPRIIADYDRDLQVTDAAVARLLQALDRLHLTDSLLVILHADHGQSLGQHGFVGHGNDLYDASVRVPLLIRFPGRTEAGKRIGVQVRNVDILPTILDDVGVEIPRGLDGRSLRTGWIARALAPLPAYVETYTPEVVLLPMKLPNIGTVIAPVARFAVRSERWKFIKNKFSAPCSKGQEAYRSLEPGRQDVWELRDPVALSTEECQALKLDELYDLTTDPSELQNVAPMHPDVVEQQRAWLQAVTRHEGKGEAIRLSPSDRERLRSLGYSTGDG